MNEEAPVQIDPSEIKWMPPHGPINETYWEITFTDTPISIHKILICAIGLLVLALLVFFIFRKLAHS